MVDILTLADARAALRLPATDTSNDADLTATYLPAVTSIVEDLAGPQLTQTKTWTTDGGRTTILLPTAVQSVTSVTETGVVLVAGVDYTTNLKAGIITRGSTQTPYVFLPGQQNIVITYVAGTGTIPANVKLAARIILRHLWQVDQQGFRPQFGAPDADTVQIPSGYAIPRRAFELLRPSQNVPGFA